MPSVTVTSTYEWSVDVDNVEYVEVEDGMLALLDEEEDILALFAAGAWTSVVYNND